MTTGTVALLPRDEPRVVFSLSLVWRLLAGTMLTLSLLHLITMTAPVRLANTDDVKMQSVMQGDLKSQERYFVSLSIYEARFYFATILFPLPFHLYQISDPLLFSACRMVVLLIHLGLFGSLVARIFRHEVSGWLYVIISLNALHIPAMFYPVLSCFGYSTGCIAQLLSFHCFLSYLRRDRTLVLLGTVVFQMVALLFSENLLIFSSLYPALTWIEKPRERISQLMKLQLGPLSSPRLTF